jgi:trigger factor
MRDKRHTAVALALVLGVTGLAGCGSESQDYNDYVTLGEYKDLPVTLNVAQVTDEDVETYEKEQLSGFEEYTDVDTPIVDGSYVELSLLAKNGSDIVYDFTSEGYEMIVGDQEFGVEVDDALIGKQVGDELELTVSYDEDFDDAALYGKEISYEITVQRVADVTYPELTDEFIQETFDEDNLSAWEETLREELTASYEADATDDMREDLADQAVKNATITGYPKSLYEAKKSEVDENYQSYADMFNCSLDAVYEMLEVDEDSLQEEYLYETNRVMVFSLIRDQEGITLSDEDYQTRLTDFAAENEYDSVDELLEDYDEDSLRSYFLDEMTLDFLEDEADITISSSDET